MYRSNSAVSCPVGRCSTVNDIFLTCYREIPLGLVYNATPAISVHLFKKKKVHGRLRYKNVQFLGAFTKLRKATISFVVSVRLCVRPHGATRLPLDGFL